MKKNLIIIYLLITVLLTACASQPATPAYPAGPQDGGQNNPGGGQRGLSSRLAIGTLKLEGTNFAVTADEAKTLLPLWQKVKTMEANTTTNSSDLQAVYQQIQGDMTSDQIQQITNMTLSQADYQSLAQQYGVQITPGANVPFGGNFPTLSPEERATRQAQFPPQNGGNSQNGTPPAGGRGFGRGFNTVFVDPLIQLLQQRAGG